MSADSEPRAGDGTPLGRQWLVAVAPPTIVLLDLQVAYMLVPHPGTGSSGPERVAHVAFLLIAAAVGAAAFALWRSQRASRRSEAPARVRRGEFLSLLGVLASLLAVLTIAAQIIPTMMLH